VNKKTAIYKQKIESLAKSFSRMCKVTQKTPKKEAESKAKRGKQNHVGQILSWFKHVDAVC